MLDLRLQTASAPSAGRITNGPRDQASEPGKLEAREPLPGLQLPGYRRWVDLQELINLLEAARGRAPRRRTEVAIFLTQIDFSRF
jgi:hypothetical protein